MILHTAIIIIFTVLIAIHLYKCISKPTIIEGAEFDTNQYTDPNLNKDPVYLAQLNAANIAYLKGRIDDVSKLRQEVNSLSQTVNTNASGIAEMNTHLSKISNSITGTNATSYQTTTTTTTGESDGSDMAKLGTATTTSTSTTNTA